MSKSTNVSQIKKGYVFNILLILIFLFNLLIILFNIPANILTNYQVSTKIIFLKSLYYIFFFNFQDVLNFLPGFAGVIVVLFSLLFMWFFKTSYTQNSPIEYKKIVKKLGVIFSLFLLIMGIIWVYSINPIVYFSIVWQKYFLFIAILISLLVFSDNINIWEIIVKVIIYFPYLVIMRLIYIFRFLKRIFIKQKRQVQQVKLWERLTKYSILVLLILWTIKLSTFLLGLANPTFKQYVYIPLLEMFKLNQILQILTLSITITYGLVSLIIITKELGSLHIFNKSTQNKQTKEHDFINVLIQILKLILVPLFLFLAIYIVFDYWQILSIIFSQNIHNLQLYNYVKQGLWMYGVIFSVLIISSLIFLRQKSKNNFMFIKILSTFNLLFIIDLMLRIYLYVRTYGLTITRIWISIIVFFNFIIVLYMIYQVFKEILNKLIVYRLIYLYLVLSMFLLIIVVVLPWHKIIFKYWTKVIVRPNYDKTYIFTTQNPLIQEEIIDNKKALKNKYENLNIDDAILYSSFKYCSLMFPDLPLSFKQYNDSGINQNLSTNYEQLNVYYDFYKHGKINKYLEICSNVQRTVKTRIINSALSYFNRSSHNSNNILPNNAGLINPHFFKIVPIDNYSDSLIYVIEYKPVATIDRQTSTQGLNSLKTVELRISLKYTNNKYYLDISPLQQIDKQMLPKY